MKFIFVVSGLVSFVKLINVINWQVRGVLRVKKLSLQVSEKFHISVYLVNHFYL